MVEWEVSIEVKDMHGWKLPSDMRNVQQNTQTTSSSETKIGKMSNEPLVNGKVFISPGTSCQLSQNCTVRPIISLCSAE